MLLRWLLCLLGLLLLSCKAKSCEITDRPADPNPPRTGITYRLAFQTERTTTTNMREWTDWNRDQRTRLREVLPTLLHRTGDTWVFVDNEIDADFVLRTFDARSCSDHGAEAWLPSEPRSIYFDTDCFGGLDVLTIGAAHGVGHALDYRRNHAQRIPDGQPLPGMRHICRHAADEDASCHPHLLGIAIMSRMLPAQMDPQTRDAVFNDPNYRQLDVRMFNGEL